MKIAKLYTISLLILVSISIGNPPSDLNEIDSYKILGHYVGGFEQSIIERYG